MAKHDALVIDYTVYKDGIEYLGTTEITLPDVEYLSETISGGGISGEVEDIITGHISAMTTTMNWRVVTKRAVQLCEPKYHKIEVRVAQQQLDSKDGSTSVLSAKHVLKIKPKKTSFGKVAAASTADVSGDYATSYFATYINGEKVTEIDPLNFICLINGTDYLADVRHALGK